MVAHQLALRAVGGQVAGERGPASGPITIANESLMGVRRGKASSYSAHVRPGGTRHGEWIKSASLPKTRPQGLEPIPLSSSGCPDQDTGISSGLPP